MFSLYPMPGMGATGMGMGPSPQVSPQMMAGMPMGAAQTSPMSEYLAMAHPMMNGANGALQAPVAGPPAPQNLGAAMSGMGQQLSPLLAALSKGQTGVAPGLPSSTPGLAWNPMNAVGTESLGGMTANQGGVMNLLNALRQRI